MDNRITVALGRKGSGKSWWSRATQWNQPRLLLLDTLQEHELPDALRILSLQDLRDALIQGNAGDETTRFRYVYTPRDMDNDFPRVAELVAALPHVLFAVDELSLYMDNRNFESPHFERMIRIGRHYGQSFHGIAHRMADVPPLLRMMADRLALFNTHEPNDLDYYAKRIGQEAAAALPGLPVWKPGLPEWSPGVKGAPLMFESGMVKVSRKPS